MKKITIENRLGVVLVFVTTAVYLSSFGGVFLFDDYTAILRNPNVTGDSAVFSGHRWLVDLSFYWNMRLSEAGTRRGDVLMAFGHAEADLEQVLNAAIAESIRERREE